MSSSVIFLLAMIGFTLVGGFVLWLRERSPQSMEAHIKAFERERQALSPEFAPEPLRHRPGVPADTRPPTKGPRPG